jgi:glycolate oxidase
MGALIDAATLAELRRIVGHGQVLTRPEDCFTYGYDAAFHQSSPDVVVKVTSTDQVSRVVRLAYRAGIPLTPRGAGTSLSGGPVPLTGGIVLAMHTMNRVLELNKEDCLVVVEPGVITGHLQRLVEKEGLYFPPDPQSADFCTIGGNIGENASGPHGLKYGSTRDYLLGLEVVLPDGEVITVGGRTVKNVTGFDLTRLFCGSEGLLGVVTKANIKLIPKPETKVVLLAIFKDWAAAGRAVADIIAAGILPTTLEIMDDVSIRAAEDYGHFGLPVDAGALLVIEVDGFRESMERQADGITAVCRRAGAVEVRAAHDAAAQADAWAARKVLSPATSRLAPAKFAEDITVPRSKIPELVVRLKDVGREIGLPVIVYGHAGDGNLHPGILTDERDPDKWARAQRGIELFFKHAIELGGTLSGEHGVGYMKAPFLPLEYSPRAIGLMRDIKNVIDPKGLMNQGKMFPDPRNPLRPSTG